VSKRDYDDIPGTYVLDSRSYRKGYNLNMFLMTLNKSVHRDEFASNEKVYIDKFNVSEEQKQAVINRDYLQMLKLGANVYYTFKLVSHDRLQPQLMYGKMSDPELSFEEFQQMMLSGGRSIEGNRSKKEKKNG
jgi:protocatechuate 4,5-dioxygenase alpha chain